MSSTYSHALGRSHPIEASTKEEMIELLEKESLFWADFIQTVANDQNLGRFLAHNNATLLDLNSGYAILTQAAESPEKFNHTHIGTRPYGATCLIMPLSSSIEGAAIHDCFILGFVPEATLILIGFLREVGLVSAPDSDLRDFTRKADIVLASIRINVNSLMQKADGRKIAGYLRRLETSASRAEGAALAIETKDQEQIKKIEELNAQYEEMAGVIQKKVVQKFLRFHESAALEREILVAENATFAEERGSKVRHEVAALASLRNQLEEDFHDLHAMYNKHLQYQRPSILWKARATEHKKKANQALKVFWGLAIFVCGLVVVLFSLGFGRYVAESFVASQCDSLIGVFCTTQFSYEGPLLVASILLISSLFLWVTRLQYRIYLSERHLGLSAEERKAFAETYLAMRGDNTVSQDNEAIVLGALFRPTQDGIVKDDDGGFDVSAASIIARHLGGNKQS